MIASFIIIKCWSLCQYYYDELKNISFTGLIATSVVSFFINFFYKSWPTTFHGTRKDLQTRKYVRKEKKRRKRLWPFPLRGLRRPCALGLWLVVPCPVLLISVCLSVLCKTSQINISFQKNAIGILFCCQSLAKFRVARFISFSLRRSTNFLPREDNNDSDTYLDQSLCLETRLEKRRRKKEGRRI